MRAERFGVRQLLERVHFASWKVTAPQENHALHFAVKFMRYPKRNTVQCRMQAKSAMT
ncbi:MAG: hypothetical protein GF350_06115 [Chitinivibrionales bacterium]|nr:hypothetical protein [Chitinivibrionales bacterium]